MGQNFTRMTGPLEKESDKSRESEKNELVEKVKRKKKVSETLRLRTCGQRVCTCEEKFFFFFFFLKLNGWVTCGRERKKNLKSWFSWIQLWAAVCVEDGLLGSCWCWRWAASGLGKKKKLMVYFNGLLLPVGWKIFFNWTID